MSNDTPREAIARIIADAVNEALAGAGLSMLRVRDDAPAVLSKADQVLKELMPPSPSKLRAAQ